MQNFEKNTDRIRRGVWAIGWQLRDIAGLVKSAIQEYPRNAAEARVGPTEPIDPTTRFEHSDISAKWVVVGGYSVLATTGIIVGFLYFYFSFLAHHRAAMSPPVLPLNASGDALPPNPRLQKAPVHDLQELQKSETSLLTGYWWVDRKQGVVGLPIERAMDVLLQRGIPPQDAPPALKLYPPRSGDPSVTFEGKVAPEPR